MKKLYLYFVVLAVSISALSGCRKSDDEKMKEARIEQGIELLSEEQALSTIVEGKKAFRGIFEGVDYETELYDEFDMAYNPFLEVYDSPEKIKTEIEVYYAGDYAESLLAMIPAEYVGGRYALPIGDGGMTPEYDKFKVVDVKDINEEYIKLTYKAEEEAKESYSVYFEYIDGEWKITDEIRQLQD